MSNTVAVILRIGGCVLAVAGMGHAAAAPLLFLPGDVHLDASVEEASAQFVSVRVGRQVYELERESLKGEALDLLPQVDTRMGLIHDLVPHLTSTDQRVRRASAAGLGALGLSAVPLLEAVRDGASDPARRAALDAILTTLGAPTQDGPR